MDLHSSQAMPVGKFAEFHPSSGELWLGHRKVRLRPQTALVLAYLLANSGRVVGKDELLEAVWPNTVVTDNSLAQCIAEIRQALGVAGRRVVQTVPRRGFRLDPPRDRLDATAPRPMVLALCAAAVAGAALWWHLSTRGAAPSAEPLPRLSLAILPMAAAGREPEQAAFAAQITEGLAMSASQLPGARVIELRHAGRSAVARYVVDGGVVEDAGRLRVDLRLSDGGTGARLWTESVDMDAGLLQVEGRDIPGRVARLLQEGVLAADFAARRQAGNGARAPDPAVQALRLWMRGTPQDNAAARALALQALEADPDSVLAWRVVAASFLLERSEAWSADPEGALDRAEVAARRAQAIDPRHPQVHAILGAVMAMRGRYDEALAALEAELAMGFRQDPLVHEWLGVTYMLMGRPRQAIQPLETAIWLSPRDARLSALWRELAIAYVHIGDLCHAREDAWRAVRTPRPMPRSYETLAAICAMSGDSECTQSATAELLRIEPRHKTVLGRADLWSTAPEFRARQADYVESLRKVGLR
jgi:DNA-binding winged helix-turn-helix (wHTH) protein/TolB-like protein/tetratricopeptide (TPR) repeat protein